MTDSSIATEVENTETTSNDTVSKAAVLEALNEYRGRLGEYQYQNLLQRFNITLPAPQRVRVTVEFEGDTLPSSALDAYNTLQYNRNYTFNAEFVQQ